MVNFLVSYIDRHAAKYFPAKLLVCPLQRFTLKYRIYALYLTHQGWILIGEILWNYQVRSGNIKINGQLHFASLQECNAYWAPPTSHTLYHTSPNSISSIWFLTSDAVWVLSSLSCSHNCSVQSLLNSWCRCLIKKLFTLLTVSLLKTMSSGRVFTLMLHNAIHI